MSDLRLRDIESRYNFVQKMQVKRLTLRNVNVGNVSLLSNFVNSCQKIVPRFFTRKRCTIRLKTQRQLSRTIKRSRQLGLLRFKH